MRAANQRDQVVSRLADTLVEAQCGKRQQNGSGAGWSSYARLTDPVRAAVYDAEVEALLKGSSELRRVVKKASVPDASGRMDGHAHAEVQEVLNRELASQRDHARRVLEVTLGGAETRTGPVHARWTRTQRVWDAVLNRFLPSVRRVLIPLLWLDAIILSAMATGPLLHVFFGAPLPGADPLLLALSICAVWALAFIPGWLLVRFLDRRAGALWDEYVIHLHRLGLDRPRLLPKPPTTSSYYRTWFNDGGPALVGQRSIYQEKFDAYYGRSLAEAVITRPDRPVKPEALFPVFLCTGLLAVGGTAAFYDPEASFGSPEATAWTVMLAAFGGAYLYMLQMLMRRYFQGDLRSSAYVNGYVRIVTAIIVAIVLWVTAVPMLHLDGEEALAIAFVVGWFPNIGIHWLLRATGHLLGSTVPSLEAAYPLNRLDGLNTWYEARLLEEGIEDLQNLATAKIVDVLLHTRVPVARLVDWIDQAVLLIHLPAEPAATAESSWRPRTRQRRATDKAKNHPRAALRGCGIRSGSCLLRALHPDREPAEIQALFDHLQRRHVSNAQLQTLYAVVSADPRLAPVLNWQEGDVQARCSARLGPLPFPPCVDAG